MLTDVKERLNSLGITASSEPGIPDEYLLSFSIEKVSNHINNQTNLTEIPQGLHEIAVDMVVGEFLYAKKSMGLLDVGTLNFDAAEKSIQDGDTTVEYAVNTDHTPETRFEAFLNYLKHNEVDFMRYRVLLW